MHMADALVSPAVGGTMWAASAGLIGFCSRKVKAEIDDGKIPLMGVLGAFIFAAQMINFTIPGTGSSGHIGGGMILAIVLGPYAAFLTMASILTIQALFFADGGLLALGCNIFNLGFFPCFIAYPLVYKFITGNKPGQARALTGAILASVVGLQLGSLGVVLQTVISGLAELSFTSFLVLMQPIHFLIGIVEGFATAAVVAFILKSRPEVLERAATSTPLGNLSVKNILVALLITTAITGGIFSWFASAYPDGLEWSLSRVTGKEELAPPEKGAHNALAGIQSKTALLPDYGFKPTGNEIEGKEKWPVADAGTTVSGLVGGALTLILAVLIGFLLKKRKKTV